MNDMTLPSRHRIRNSSLGGLMPCTVPRGSRRLNTILFFTSGWGRNIFVSFKPPRQGNEPGNEPGIGVKGSGANRYPRPPPIYNVRNITENRVIRQRTNSLDI